jgi:PAS domain-containing protein
MPLVKDGRLAALLAVHDKEPRVWTEPEIALEREVAERCWAHVERVHAQDEAHESERFYQGLFNTIDEGFCIIGFFDGPYGPLSDYVHVEANAAYTANAGIPDVVGQKVREMVPDEAEGWVELYRDVLLTETRSGSSASWKRPAVGSSSRPSASSPPRAGRSQSCLRI